MVYGRWFWRALKGEKKLFLIRERNRLVHRLFEVMFGCDAWVLGSRVREGCSLHPIRSMSLIQIIVNTFF